MQPQLSWERPRLWVAPDVPGGAVGRKTAPGGATAPRVILGPDCRLAVPRPKAAAPAGADAAVQPDTGAPVSLADRLRARRAGATA